MALFLPGACSGAVPEAKTERVGSRAGTGAGARVWVLVRVRDQVWKRRQRG